MNCNREKARSVAFVGLIMASSFVLTACAPQIMSSNERSVTVGDVTRLNEQEALDVATKWCARYGRHAQLNQTRGNRFDYNCVD